MAGGFLALLNLLNKTRRSSILVLRHEQFLRLGALSLVIRLHCQFAGNVFWDFFFGNSQGVRILRKQWSVHLYHTVINSIITNIISRTNSSLCRGGRLQQSRAYPVYSKNVRRRASLDGLNVHSSPYRNAALKGLCPHWHAIKVYFNPHRNAKEHFVYVHTRFPSNRMYSPIWNALDANLIHTETP